VTAFGPQLIGATEKSLNALLRHVLETSGLSEPQWVTLRLAAQNNATLPLAAFVRERTHFADAEVIVAEMQRRGLLDGDTLTADGHALLNQLQGRVAALTAPVWADLDPDDVAAAERVLATVTARVGEVLGSLDG
jgi:hypothetical protein